MEDEEQHRLYYPLGSHGITNPAWAAQALIESMTKDELRQGASGLWLEMIQHNETDHIKVQKVLDIFCQYAMTGEYSNPYEYMDGIVTKNTSPKVDLTEEDVEELLTSLEEMINNEEDEENDE